MRRACVWRHLFSLKLTVLVVDWQPSNPLLSNRNRPTTFYRIAWQTPQFWRLCGSFYRR